jgi:hypothetical protein
VEITGVELEGVAVSRRDSETSPGGCANESWSDSSVSGEDQKLGHRIASACFVGVNCLKVMDAKVAEICSELTTNIGKSSV